MSNGHPASCSECVRCVECEGGAWCTSEPGTGPCPHLEPICSECWPGDCIPCRLEAEQEMYRSGEYDPRADPFFNHLAPEPVDAIARDGGYAWDGGWTARPNPKESA